MSDDMEPVSCGREDVTMATREAPMTEQPGAAAARMRFEMARALYVELARA